MVPPHQYFYRDTISRRMPTKANKERLSHKQMLKVLKKLEILALVVSKTFSKYCQLWKLIRAVPSTCLNYLR